MSFRSLKRKVELTDLHTLNRAMSTPLNLLQISNMNKSFGLQVLFSDASFSVNAGEHIGVIGPNGAGKTTLFKILNGEAECDSGQVVKSRALKIGYLSQHDQWAENETGNTYLERVCTLPVWQAKLMGKDLQLTEEILARPILSLSGGYRMRIKLIGLLGCEPNLMMLDEPTNYLDLETTLLLENFLQNYEGAFLLISHDREFLRRTTDHTLEVESGDIIKYSGNIDDYFEQKQLLREQLEAQYQNQMSKKNAIMDFVNRFGAKATKARQAQSRLKLLDKMETIELKSIPVKSVIKIPQPTPVGKTVIRLQGCSFGYNNTPIINEVSLDINRHDHVAVVGLNGAGKSTLLKGLSGLISPLKGERQLGHHVDLAIFNQHVAEVLNPEQSVFEALESAASKEVISQEIRDMAGSLLFSADSIEKKIKVLSGGEKSRVALGQILLKRVPLLLLDEPTNHLDFETVEALTQSLSAYAGTLIVVSHDRGFIRRIATKILEVSQNQVHLYPGSYDDYVWSLQRKITTSMNGDAELLSKTLDKNLKSLSSAPNDQNQENVKEGLVWKNQNKQIKTLERSISKMEQQILKLESENQEINLAISSADTTPSTLQENLKALSANTLAIQQLEQSWEEALLELEKLKSKES